MYKRVHDLNTVAINKKKRGKPAGFPRRGSDNQSLLLFDTCRSDFRSCCRCGFTSCRSSLPIVQVVGDAMAVAAFRELGHDSGCVRHAVAVLALGNHLVFFLVAGHAEQCLMLGLAGNEEIECLAVAGSALLGRRIGTVSNVLWLVSLVTLFAVARALISRVRLVTLGTLRNFAVNVVTEGAGEFAVLARICLQLGNLRSVAGEARIGYITAENNFLRLVRILVTTETTAEFVVGFSFMALAAERDDLFDRGRVSLVAILAGYLCFMGASLRFHICRSLGVALDAVSAGELDCRFGCRCRRLGGRCSRRSGGHCCRSKQKQSGQQRNDAFHFFHYSSL